MFRWTPVVNLVCASLFGIPAREADEALKSVELQQAATADAGKVEFFEAKIRPVLVAHCYACHATDAKDFKGGLLLDSRQGMLVG